MKASSLFLVFIFALAGSITGQTRTVTNRDLDKYKTQRVSAERELRDDYERLGLPSPEERAKLNEKEAREISELAARLRSSRIAAERERAASENARAALQASAVNAPVQAVVVIESGTPVYYYPWQGGWYRYRRPYTGARHLPQQNGYYAGGQFWPTGPKNPPRPLFRRSR